MCLKAFYLGKTLDMFRLFPEKVFRIVNQAGLLNKMIHGKGRGKTCGARSGKDMVRAGHIVPDRLRCILAEKERPCVTDPSYVLQGIIKLQLKVLRGNPVCKLKGRFKVFDDYERPVFFKGRLADILSRKLFYLHCQSLVYLAGNGFRGCNQNGGCYRVVLCL